MASTLNREIWLGEVSRNLVQNSGFWVGTKNDSTFVNQFGKVNIPQMLANPTINTYSKGVTVLPLTAAVATSDILEYSTELAYSDPIYGDVVDQAQYAFDITAEAAKNIADGFLKHKQLKYLYNWTVTATASLGQTTGAARTNIYGNAAAKAVTDADFLKANLYLNKQGVSLAGRRVVLSVTMLNDLLASIGTSNFNFTLTDAAMARGAVAMYRGFEIYVSNYTSAFSVANAKKAIGAAVVNTDKESAIFFHPDFVRHASTEPIMLIGDGTQYLVDEMFSMKMWLGSSVSYKETDNAIVGVYTLIEGA